MKNKKNLLIIIGIIVLALVLTALICVVVGMRSPGGDDPTTGSTTQAPTQNTTGGMPDSTTLPPATDGTTPATQPTTVPATDPTTEPTTEPTTAPTTAPTTEPTVPPTTEPTVTVPSGINCPYVIPGTKLVLEAINPYTGVFLEDGSDVDANNIYAIVVRNASSSCVEYMEITLTRADGKKLSFVASAIDAGARVVIMEANAATYEEAGYTDCTARVAMLDKLEMSESLIKVEKDAGGSLVVTNISNADIPCVRIFYKFYMPAEDVDVYVGGITYTAKLTNLAAGHSVVVKPSHYAKGSSKIVMIKVYDTVD